MAVINPIKPNVYTLEFIPEPDDSYPYLKFTIDTDNYNLSINNNKIRLTHTWSPTEKSFIQTLSELNKNEIISLFPNIGNVDFDKTYANIKSYIESISESNNVNWNLIKTICRMAVSDKQALYDIITDYLKTTNVCYLIDENMLRDCLVMKWDSEKTAEVFIKYIIPYLKNQEM